MESKTPSRAQEQTSDNGTQIPVLDGSSVVELALELLRVESISNSEGPMADVLEFGWFRPRGWHVTRQLVPKETDSTRAEEESPNNSAPRYNIYAQRWDVSENSKRGSPRLIFNSHIDTVPPYIVPSVSDGKIHGRGACDTKSIIAAQLMAAEALIAEGIEDIGMLYVVSEETNHSGMKAANALGIDAKFLVVGEPTQSKMITRQKGIVKARLVTSGIAAHSGYPETGKSAIVSMLDVLNDLRNTTWIGNPSIGYTTLNIGTINGGRAANIVPNRCEAALLIRVVTSWSEIFEQLKEIVGNRAEVFLDIANDPVDLSTLEGYETAIASFNTDIPFFEFPSKEGKAFLIGPGSILDAHTSHEHVCITELEKSVGLYQSIAKRLLVEDK